MSLQWLDYANDCIPPTKSVSVTILLAKSTVDRIEIHFTVISSQGSEKIMHKSLV